jgi:rhodanese-related sulfurtransferase
MSAQSVLPRIGLGLVLASVSVFAFLRRDQINLGSLDAWLGLVGLLAPLALGLLAAVALLLRLIARFRPSFSWTEVGDLKRRLDDGEPVTVIDVRRPDEFIGPLGHIANARNIPVADLNERFSEISGLEREPIVLVCRTDKRSAAAAQTLRAAGFTQVNVLRRGMEQWNEADLPTEGRATK